MIEGLDNPGYLTQAVEYGGMCTGKDMWLIISGLLDTSG